MSDTIFGKIISGEIPSELLYEDEHCVVINDINPQAPVHVLIIPQAGYFAFSRCPGYRSGVTGAPDAGRR